MKNFTIEDLDKMSDKEVLLLCIAHWKNILKEELKFKNYDTQKSKEFIYKRKLIQPEIFIGQCVLCQKCINCKNCIMYKYWTGKFNEKGKTCMQYKSTFVDWYNNKEGATKECTTKAVIKALQHRLNVLRKEEKRCQ